MKSKKFWLITIVILGLLAGACGSPATPTAAPVVSTPTQAAEPTATPKPTAVPEATAADLDAAFSAFLAGMKDYNSITVADLQKRMAEEYQPSSADITPKTKSFLLDVRDASEIEQAGHIQGAVNIPIRDLAKNLDKLPGFTAPIVVYCSSGWRCALGMTALGALGWNNVFSLGEQSFTSWVDAGYQVMAGLPVKALPLKQAKPNLSLVAAVDKALSSLPDDFAVVEADKLKTDLAEVSNLVLIDVRTANENKEKGAIESDRTVNIPLEDFIARRSEWPADKNTPIVVYADASNRSAIALQILETYGYTNVRGLAGGLEAWAQAGLPLATH